MLKILTGPAGAEKSKKMLEELVESSLQRPEESFLLIVPEQSTLQMQRKVIALHPKHVIMNIDVLSFERLAYRVFEEQGISNGEILNDTGKTLILRKVLEECREDLTVYRNKVHMTGFSAAIRSLVTELRQYDVDDNTLFLMQEMAQQKNNPLLYGKLQDIRRILRRFQEEIREKYSTPEETLSRFARVIPQSEIIKNASVFMDGFTGFTPVQYRVLSQLLKYCREVTLTLTLPENDAAKAQADAGHCSIYQLSLRTLDKLKSLATEQKKDIKVLPVPENRPVPRAYFCQEQSRREEADFIAGMICKGIRTEKKRFRDYAVIASDMETYYDLLRNAFREAGISCFLDYKSELGNNLLARMLGAALELLTDRFSLSSLTAFLKTGISKLEPDEVCLLENYCLEFGIQGFGSFQKPFEKNRPLHGQKDAYFWDLSAMNHYREQVLSLLSGFYRNLSSGHPSVKEICGGLLELLDRNGAEEKMQQMSEQFYASEDASAGKEYEQIYGRIRELLEQIGRLMGQDVMELREFRNLLIGALDEIRIGIIPPSLDAVMVGDLTRTRLEDVKVLFLAGFNDGLLPAPARTGGLFTRKERELLKEEHFELAPTVLEELYTQYFYVSLMLSKPSEALYLTCAGTDEEGKELLPSCMSEELGELMPGLTVQPLPPKSQPQDAAPAALLAAVPAQAEIPSDLAEVSSPYTADDPGMLWEERAVLQLSSGIRSYVADADPDKELPVRQQQLLSYFAQEQPEILKKIFAGAFFSNRALPLDEQTALDLYGDVLSGSVSRYEKYYECPFKHFLNYGLSLKERPEYQLKAADIGTVYHDSLERYARTLAERGLSFREISDEESRRIAEECVAASASSMESDVMQDTRRNAFLLKRMIQVTQKTTDVLRMQVKDGLYEPSCFELSIEEQPMNGAAFHGKIDRVDLYDGGDLFVKIIDYKSGSKKFSIRDIYTGQQLQLVAYLKSAVKQLQKEHPDKTVRPGGIYYYLIQDRFVSDEKEAAGKFRMSGLTNSDPQAVNAIDTTLSPGQSSTIAEISYGKDGLSARSKVASDGEFAHLMHFVDEKIADVAAKIRAGDVSIAPSYESSTKNACTYCEFKEVCKFEPGKWGSDYRELPSGMEAAEIEKELYGRDKLDTGTA